MALPTGGDFLPIGVAEFEAPDDVNRTVLTEDYELGGTALNDPSQGLQVQFWKIAYQNDLDIVIAPFPYTTWTVLLQVPNVTWITFCFDQNMAPTVTYIANGQGTAWWYDTAVGQRVFTNISGMVTPYMTMDDKRNFATLGGTNDMLLFYIFGNELRYRQQRDRFATPYTRYTFAGPNVSIRRCGMNTSLKMQIEVEGTDAQ